MGDRVRDLIEALMYETGAKKVVLVGATEDGDTVVVISLQDADGKQIMEVGT
jgi:hypothetical protein